jgi:proline dehydrogenase
MLEYAKSCHTNPNRGLMLRSFLISLSSAGWAQRLVTSWKIAWNVASRFVAGNNIQDAILVVKDLNKAGIRVTLDHLGESTTSLEEAKSATEDILILLDEIDKSGVNATVSIKLTQIGLALDEAVCAKNLEAILERAKLYNNFVRIDMEDSPFTDKTIELYKQALRKGFTNFGLVIQAYLYRSVKDVEDLLTIEGRIRLVKGAYMEPASIAYPKKNDVDNNYDAIAKKLLEFSLDSPGNEANLNGRFPPITAIGTHDPKRIQFAKDYASLKGIPKDQLEFQMLYGIRRDLQKRCADEGYPVRVYVPYGEHWYPYFMRRLAERPANLWFFASNFFRK